MATQIENLWGEAIGAKEDITLPKTILTHQANYLKKISHNILQGEVLTTSSYYTPILEISDLANSSTIRNKMKVHTLSHDFYITLPKDNYRYRLLGVSHDIGLYPLTIHGYLEDENFKANDEEEFKSILTRLFRSPKTQRVLNILTSQAKA